MSPIIALAAVSSVFSLLGPVQDEKAQVLVDKINAERKSNGLSTLTESATLRQLAQAHAEDMARLDFAAASHPEGTPLLKRARANGIKALALSASFFKGETLSSEAAFAGWMKSRDDVKNILRTASTEVGVAVAEREGKRYFAAVFGAPTGKNLVKRNPAVDAIITAELAALPKEVPLPAQIALDSFERGNFAQWRPTDDSNCWGRFADDASTTGLRVDGYSGSYFLSSAHPPPGDNRAGRGTGVLHSPRFPITHKTLRFKIGGGNYPRDCAVNLLVPVEVAPRRDGDEGEDKLLPVSDPENIVDVPEYKRMADKKTVMRTTKWRIVRTETGDGSNRLHDVEWDLSDLVGNVARIQVVDRVKIGSFGYIMVDDLSLDRLPEMPGVAMAPEPVSPEAIITTVRDLPAKLTPKAIAGLSTRSITGSALSIPTETLTLPDGRVVVGKPITLEATGYGPGENGQWGDRTYLNTKVGLGTVAVDPRVIPLRSKLWVEGYGFCTALDIGGAIKGNRIDLGFNDDITANNYGRKKVKVIILDPETGG